MKIVYFTHSLMSCWNHGNAHFQRGLLRELQDLGHVCVAAEPLDSWSRTNLVRAHGETALTAFQRAFPELQVATYSACEVDGLVDGADAVIVHEWTPSDLVGQLARLRKGSARFTLLFHDTHHRAISSPDDIGGLVLDGFDGVLAFGECLADIYRKRGWGRRSFVFHEAADTRLFRPPDVREQRRSGVIWVGNWGDGERTTELEEFLFAPAHAADLSLRVFGVRYPAEALATLRKYGASYHGWIPNTSVPSVFASALATVHVPRRIYSHLLPGIPTIRVFEALACGIPLVCAPWDDTELLFAAGRDYVRVSNGLEAKRALTAISQDVALRAELVRSGLATIWGRHTCRHRAEQLVRIIEDIRQTVEETLPCA